MAPGYVILGETIVAKVLFTVGLFANINVGCSFKMKASLGLVKGGICGCTDRKCFVSSYIANVHNSDGYFPIKA